MIFIYAAHTCLSCLRHERRSSTMRLQRDLHGFPPLCDFFLLFLVFCMSSFSGNISPTTSHPLPFPFTLSWPPSFSSKRGSFESLFRMCGWKNRNHCTSRYPSQLVCSKLVFFFFPSINFPVVSSHFYFIFVFFQLFNLTAECTRPFLAV